VAPGHIIGLLGPNGSGKTTLIRVLAGLLAPQAGRVTLDGRPLESLGRLAIARRVAVVPQETLTVFDYSVIEMVLMGRYPHLGPLTLEGPEDHALAHQALTATGMLAFADRRFKSLSGGEKQRVVIASALAQGANLLLLDEPTTALDLGYQVAFAGLLRELRSTRGTAVLLSTHDLSFAAAVCDHAVLLHHGEAVAAGVIDDVLRPDAIRHVYGVDVDVQFQPRAGHLIVVPCLPPGSPAAAHATSRA